MAETLPPIRSNPQEAYELVRRAFEIDALKLAEEAGTALVQNVVLVGALSALPEFSIDRETMLEAIRVSVPEKAVEANIRAFERDYGAIKALL